jgi:hypothetical protein
MSQDNWEDLRYCNGKALTLLRGSLIPTKRAKQIATKNRGGNDLNKATMPGGGGGRSPENTS